MRNFASRTMRRGWLWEYEIVGSKSAKGNTDDDDDDDAETKTGGCKRNAQKHKR